MGLITTSNVGTKGCGEGIPTIAEGTGGGGIIFAREAEDKLFVPSDDPDSFEGSGVNRAGDLTLSPPFSTSGGRDGGFSEALLSSLANRRLRLLKLNLLDTEGI